MSSSKEIYEALYNEHFENLYRYAKVICNSSELAKDVVSDFFYNLIKNKTDLDRIENLKSYLFVSIKNLCLQSLTRKSNLHMGLDSEPQGGLINPINPEDLMLEKELEIQLEKIVSELPDQRQLIFRMAREKGMKYSEISTELGISVETVRSQLMKAQTKLREEISNFYLDYQKSRYAASGLTAFLLFLLSI